MYQSIEPLYLTVLIILLLLIYWIQFKIRNPFWSYQPVSHFHHFYRSWLNPYVINPNFYIAKFINTLNIQTFLWDDFKNQKQFCSHINIHYWRNKNECYTPSLEKHINPYFNSDTNAYISLYYLEGILVGSIINRTLRIKLYNQRFSVSYIDYLCVHKGYRRKRVAPELIQSHEYFQRTKSYKKCLVSLFKKEGVLHHFTPLVKYTTYSYDLRSKKSFLYHYTNQSSFYLYEVVDGSLSLLKHILEFMESIQHIFSCFIIPPVEILKQLIERKSIVIKCLIKKDNQKTNIVALYFFRPTGVYINSSKENIECFASVFNRCFQRDFFIGFLSSLNKIKDTYGHLQIETLGHNIILNDCINKQETVLQDTVYKYKTPCAYYLYNYSFKEIQPKDTFILL